MPKIICTPITFTLNQRKVPVTGWNKRTRTKLAPRSRKPQGYVFPADPTLRGEILLRGIMEGA